ERSSATRRQPQPSRRRARQFSVDKTMTSQLQSRARQSGAYLLEALIGILIFALGVLGIVGLQAASLRTTTDNSLRAEAVFAATQLVGQMWADKYVCVVGGGTPPCAPQYASSTLGPA